MARTRTIEAYPDHWRFCPQDAEGQIEYLTMSLDEFEVIRCLDHLGMTQEQCAAELGVARTTVTATYERARKKLAKLLVEGCGLRLAGGRYELRSRTQVVKKKGEGSMRVAVTYQDGEVFQHFGHSRQFKFYDVQDAVINSSEVVDTGDSGHGALAGFLKQHGTDALICGGIGPGAQTALAEAGIELYAGVKGTADEAVAAWLKGELVYQTTANCDHHGEGHHHGEGYHHGEGHSCGHHGEGHSCGR